MLHLPCRRTLRHERITFIEGVFDPSWGVGAKRKKRAFFCPCCRRQVERGYGGSRAMGWCRRPQWPWASKAPSLLNLCLTNWHLTWWHSFPSYNETFGAMNEFEADRACLSSANAYDWQLENTDRSNGSAAITTTSIGRRTHYSSDHATRYPHQKKVLCTMYVYLYVYIYIYT